MLVIMVRDVVLSIVLLDGFWVEFLELWVHGRKWRGAHFHLKFPSFPFFAFSVYGSFLSLSTFLFVQACLFSSLICQHNGSKSNV